MPKFIHNYNCIFQDEHDTRKAQLLLADGCRQVWEKRHFKPFRCQLSLSLFTSDVKLSKNEQFYSQSWILLKFLLSHQLVLVRIWDIDVRPPLQNHRILVSRSSIRISNTKVLFSVALDPGGSSYDRERESPDVVCPFFSFIAHSWLWDKYHNLFTNIVKPESYRLLQSTYVQQLDTNLFNSMAVNFRWNSIPNIFHIFFS